MFELVFIFLVTITMSSAAVWLYRKISGWDGFTETLVGRPQPVRRMKIGAQQGFISLVPKRAEKSRNVRLRRTQKNIKTPWGW